MTITTAMINHKALIKRTNHTSILLLLDKNKRINDLKLKRVNAQQRQKEKENVMDIIMDKIINNEEGNYGNYGTTKKKNTTTQSQSQPQQSLKRQTSTEDHFAKFCDKHVELLATSLGPNAKVILYLTEERTNGGVRLSQVASFSRGRGEEDSEEEENGESNNRGGRRVSEEDEEDENGSSSKGINNSFDWACASTSALVPATLTTLQSAETFLLNKEYFFLPSTNAMVVPLTFEGLLIGLLVGELPFTTSNSTSSSSSSSSSTFTTTAGKAKGKNRTKRRMNLNDNREDQFGDRERQCLKNAAELFVPVYLMQKRALLLMKKTYVQEQNVGDFIYDSKVPLSALRTMTGMLKTYIDEDSPAGDMADAIMAQGDILATLSRQLEDALYPTNENQQNSRMILPSMSENDLSTSSSSSSSSSAAAESIASSETRIGKALNQPPKSASQRFLPSSTPSSSSAAMKPVAKCEVVPIVAALLATSEIIANSAGVSMIASLPMDDDENEEKTCVVSVNENITRQVIARMIDSALVMSPSDGRIELVCRPQTLEVDNSMTLGVLVAIRVTAAENKKATFKIIPEDDQSLRIAADTIHQAGGVMRTVETNEQQGEIAHIHLWLPSSY